MGGFIDRLTRAVQQAGSQIMAPQRVGRMMLLVVAPVTLAFIVAWFGLGVFKPWSSRLAPIPFWVGLMLLLWNFTYLVYRLMCRKIRVRDSLPLHFGVAACSAVIGTAFFRPIASLYGHSYGWLMGYARHKVVTPYPVSLESLIIWHTDYTPFLMMWTVGILLLDFYERCGRKATSPQDNIDLFADHIETLGDEALIAVCAEGHYVRILSTHGEERIFYRFSEALSRLNARSGVRIHRSYWANLRHVKKLEGNAAKANVLLTTGLRLPVSLTYRDEVATHFGARHARRTDTSPVMAGR